MTSQSPIHLLDLSDETLQLVASFLHKDDEIPLPSFGSHWQNYESALYSNSIVDYLNFRLTCKRINGLCPLRGFHRECISMESLIAFETETPRSYVSGIRRLTLNILRDERNISLNSRWAEISNALSSLTSLEELIIEALPLCEHSKRGAQTKDLCPRQFDFLPGLKALSIEVSCTRCADALPRLFFPAAPALEHLKVAFGSYEQDHPQSHIERLIDMLQLYSTFHPDKQSPLKTLRLRGERTSGFVSDLLNGIPDIGNYCPQLRGLLVTFYFGGENVWAPLHVGTTQSDDVISTGDHEFGSLKEFCRLLVPLKQLASVDIGLELSGVEGTNRPIIYVPTKDDIWPTSDDRQCNSVNAADIAEWEAKFKRFMECRALEMLETLPHLSSGVFWEALNDEECGERPYNAAYNRWSWRKVVDEKGQVRVEIARCAEAICEEFAVDLSGTRKWRGHTV